MSLKRKQVIYVVDDDKPLNIMICKYLQSKGFSKVTGFYSGEEFLKNSDFTSDPIIIQDFDLPGMNGVEVIKTTKKDHPNAEFIMLSGQSSIDVAVEAIKYGAFDYIIKDTYAKENASNKILNILKIKEAQLNKKSFKIGFYAFLVMFGLTWLGIFIYLQIIK